MKRGPVYKTTTPYYHWSDFTGTIDRIYFKLQNTIRTYFKCQVEAAFTGSFLDWMLTISEFQPLLVLNSLVFYAQFFFLALFSFLSFKQQAMLDIYVLQTFVNNVLPG